MPRFHCPQLDRSRRQVFVLLVLLGLASGPAAAQNTPESTLFLMVRTKPDLTEDILRETLKRGLNAARCRFEDPIEITTIPPTVFEELSRLIGRGGTPVESVRIAGEVGVRPLLTRASTWELQLAGPKQVLKELSITYRKAGVREYRPAGKLPPVGKDGKAEPGKDLTFQLIVPGSYAIDILPNDEPLDYTAVIDDIDKDKPESLTKKWPEGDRYYAITIKRFVGDQAELFRTLQDKDKIPNPLKNIDPVRNFGFAFVNLSETKGTVKKKLLDGNTYTPQIAGISGVKTRRVWMQFPLSKEQAFKLADEYNRLSPEKLSQEIRRGKTVAYGINTAVGIDAQSNPAWFEMLDRGDGQGFTRAIPLKDFRGLQTKYPQFYRLIVYEFDDGESPPSAQRILHPKTGQTVLVYEEEVDGLPAELKNAVEKEPTKTPETKERPD